MQELKTDFFIQKPNKKQKKKRHTSNIILVILGLFILIFTGLCMWLFYKFQSIPDTLITAVFGAVFGEAGVMGLIKIFKTKYLESEENENGI